MKGKHILTGLSTILILIGWCIALFAQGRIIIDERPEVYRPKPVYLKSVEATVDLKHGVGNIRLEQTFHNPSHIQLEGEYLFALPGDAQVHDFHLYINGKKIHGEILDSKQAYDIYEGIVRKLRDPALLEYAGHRLFKARIFPIAPRSDRKIELSYAQVISYQAGTFRFSLPIRQSGQGSIETYHMTINLQTEAPLANIYSPSHEIVVSREGERQARITFEANHLQADKDFLLYYTLSDQEVNATVLTFRPRTDRDGFFMLLATPAYEVARKNAIPKDIIFVVDVSGSMQGEKIEQAREALRYCVNSLHTEDRFEIIGFSSTIENFQNGLKIAGKDEIQNAHYFINNLSAGGGTNIGGALKRALRLKNNPDERPTSIVFLTDGLPTEGEKDISRILQNIKNEQKEFIRIFNFGVGYDVNTYLLDKLSEDSHGSANYVKPGENIEREVSEFFARISSPVLTNPQLNFGNLRVYDVYPQELPDIFQGQRVTVIGRYRSPGKSVMLLTGKQGEKTQQFKYPVDFERRETDNEFIAKLWANRKVAHLLTQIRFNGENPELVETIKTLGTEYGIVTPYTSYLVTEQQRELVALDQQVRMGEANATELRMQSAQKARDVRSGEDEESVGSTVFFEALSAAPKAESKSVGKDAVLSSRLNKKIASGDKEMSMLLTVKRIGEKTFRLRNGIWIESDLDINSNPDQIITFLSKQYFTFSRKDSQLRRILALGEQVIFKWDNKIYKIIEM